MIRAWRKGTEEVEIGEREELGFGLCSVSAAFAKGNNKKRKKKIWEERPKWQVFKMKNGALIVSHEN